MFSFGLLDLLLFKIIQLWYLLLMRMGTAV